MAAKKQSPIAAPSDAPAPTPNIEGIPARETSVFDLPVGSIVERTMSGLSLKIPVGNGFKHGVGSSIQAALDDSNGLSEEEIKARARDSQ